MASVADRAIERTLHRGSPMMISSPRTEVGFVAAVHLGGIQRVAKSWTPILARHGLSLHVSGVFCHAAPIVAFADTRGRSRRCELADLLVVVDITGGGSFVRRAALVQAKMARAAGRVKLAGSSSRAQLDLYQNWHPFDFVEAAYGMSRVNLNAGAGAAYSGTFGVIDRHLKSVPVWTQHDASPTPLVTVSQVRLGEFIAEMVSGARTGFGRLATPSLKTDWSKMVEILLRKTYARVFHHKPTLGNLSAPRGVTATACLSFGTAANFARKILPASDGDPPYGDFEVREDDGSPSGMSILHLAVRPDSDAVPPQSSSG